MIFRTIGVITLFGFTIFLTRNYDPKIIGQYDFIRVFLLIISTLSLVGTEQSILYFSGILTGNGRMKDLKKIYFKKVVIIFVTSLVPLIIILLINKEIINLFFNDKTSYDLMLKATIILFFYCITILNTEVFRTLNKIYIAELFRNTFKYLSVILGAIYLFIIHKEKYLVDAFLVGFIFLAILSSLMILIDFRNLKNENQIHFREITYNEIIKKSFPMAISGFAFFLLLSIDIIFLKKYFGNEIVAYYSVSIKLMTILAMIIISINITVSTKIAEYYSIKNFKKLKETVKKSSRLIFLFTFPITILICIFSKFILNIFGEGYVIANNSLIILMVGQAICSAFGSSSIYLNMTGRQTVFQYILICTVLLNFLLNMILIPKYSMLGAAISFVLSTLFWNIISAIYIYKKDDIKIFLN